MTEFAPVALIPSRNHCKALPQVVRDCRALGLPVLIVDDGSDEPAAAAIAALHDSDDQVQVRRRPINGGKGQALHDGFVWAKDLGFTHAVQVDADGQHDSAALPRLLDAARADPDALISGKPVYDDSIPKARKIGRWFTHVWVFVETMSLRITDSMCGFRVYPLDSTLAVMNDEKIGRRMDFDTDIMVRLFWRGVPPVMVPVKVIYPPDNTSNFDVLHDNLRISWMHTRLVCTMLLRLPSILSHRPRPITGQAAHWSGLGERGAFWGLALTAWVYRHLGRRVCMAMLAVVTAYFHLTGAVQRRASRQFLGRVRGAQPGWFDAYRHALDFAGRSLDTAAAWSGAVPMDAVQVEAPQDLDKAKSDARGAVLVVSHHGNVEICRVLADQALRKRLTVLVHTKHAEHFNRVLKRINPDAALNLIQVTDMGPETAVMLQERVEQGEWIAIAGDRVPVTSQGRVIKAPFLGADAPFAAGPWILASLLKCPVHLLFCRKTAPGRWSMRFETFAESIELPRADRQAALADHVRRYAARLERECRAAPLQWCNFFDFWADKENAP